MTGADAAPVKWTTASRPSQQTAPRSGGTLTTSADPSSNSIALRISLGSLAIRTKETRMLVFANSATIQTKCVLSLGTTTNPASGKDSPAWHVFVPQLEWTSNGLYNLYQYQRIQTRIDRFVVKTVTLLQLSFYSPLNHFVVISDLNSLFIPIRILI